MTYTTTDYVSAELKGLSITSTSVPSTSQVAVWITEAEDEINRRTGRVWSSTVASSAIFDSDGSKYFRFPQVPIISITSFEYETNGLGAASESWSSLTEGRTNDYILYINSGEIEYTGKSVIPSAGKQKLRISYVYGNATTPPLIQRLATLIVAKRVVDATISNNAQSGGGSVTVGNISITDPTSFSVSNARRMTDEIEDLFSRVSDNHVYRPTRWLPTRT